MFRRLFCFFRAFGKAAAAFRRGPVHATERIVLRTYCHPAAKGRRPVRGDQEWTFKVVLDGGDVLFLKMGRPGREALLHMLLQEHVDDIADLMGRPPRLEHYVAPG